jgi:hypothetical protein
LVLAVLVVEMGLETKQLEEVVIKAVLTAVAVAVNQQIVKPVPANMAAMLQFVSYGPAILAASRQLVLGTYEPLHRN